MIQDWMKEIQKVARKASFDWPGIVEQEDMAQDVCLHIMESPATQRDLAAMDDNSRYRTLHKIAQRIASQARTDYEYFSGNFRYSVHEVRDALVSGVLGALGRVVLSDTGSRLKASWSEENYVSNGADHADTVLDMVSMEQDLRQALEDLERVNPRYYELVIRRFLKGEVFPTGSADSKALQRSVELLTTKMNRAHKASGVSYVDTDDRQPVDDWDKYYDWADAREEYEDSLREIHEPKPQLVAVGPDGLGTFNITRSRRA